MPSSPLLPPHLQSPDDSQSGSASNRQPLWETLVMLASFILLWVWFLQRQKALAANESLSWGWNVALLVAFGVLVWVFVRRMGRVLKALKAQKMNGGNRGRLN